jgi:hypothetical protein
MTAWPTDDDLAEVRELVRRFVPRHRQPRWLTVLEGDPAKWCRLDIDDLFRAASASGPIRSTEIAAALNAPDLIGNPHGLLLRISKPPHVLRGHVRDLVDEIVEDDALISVHRGTVVLASHHSSGWVVCRSMRT